MPVSELDDALHGDRLSEDGERGTFADRFERLPDGAIFLHEGKPHLKWKGHVLLWSDVGYTPATAVPPGQADVSVLTPRSTVRTIAAGYVPQVHESAAL